MERPDLTEDEMDEQNVRALLELLQRFGDPLKRPVKVIPWPKPSAEAIVPSKKEALTEARAVPKKLMQRTIRLEVEFG
jgi:hypothetical protein